MKPWVVLRFVAWNSCPIGAYRSYDKAGDGNESNETNPTTDLLNSLLEKSELMSHLPVKQKQQWKFVSLGQTITSIQMVDFSIAYGNGYTSCISILPLGFLNLYLVANSPRLTINMLISNL